ncbi:MAG: hypothetical protein PHI28_00520, partial [Mangrovibacterium sp.]|nr:hypothetical protein [Mangrovibacterium sp.]
KLFGLPGKPVGLCVTLALILTPGPGQFNAEAQTITKEHIRLIDYPDFPEANSTWGSIGFNPVNDCVYVGVTNHKNKVGLYGYHTLHDRIERKGFIGNMAYLRDFQWQGKIHSKIAFDQSGNVYFGTDGGESREEYFMNHPRGYSGGFLMKWDYRDERLVNLGVPMRYESIKDMDLDPVTGLIYAISYPQVHFITYDPRKNEQKDFGRLGSSHVPRVLFTDKWGNCYYVDWRQRLVKYEKSTEKLVFAEKSLPAFKGTPGSYIITGITGYAKDSVANIIYLVTYGAKMLAFHPLEKGIGQVDDLGPAYSLPDSLLWKPYVPNLNLGNNGKLYYFIGGHGNYALKDTSLFVELDPATRQKRVVMQFPLEELSEVTGSDIKDKNGNLYFAGRKVRPKTENTEEHLPSIDDNVSIPFLIKFNPGKKLN